MKMRLIRHATLWIEYGGQRILVDPMLSEAGANPPIAGSSNDRRNPLVALPVRAEELAGADAVIVTHLHRDHWDSAAASILDKDVPILCQPQDAAPLREQGFRDVRPVGKESRLDQVNLHRTEGRHGTGVTGRLMGRVSGFVLKSESEPTLYLAGDTIYCKEVEKALAQYQPDYTVVNAGGARFAAGKPITMAPGDVEAVCRKLPDSRVVAVHMDAINHCLVTRQDLRREMQQRGLAGRVLIPEDGEWIPC